MEKMYLEIHWEDGETSQTRELKMGDVIKVNDEVVFNWQHPSNSLGYVLGEALLEFEHSDEFDLDTVGMVAEGICALVDLCWNDTDEQADFYGIAG